MQVPQLETLSVRYNGFSFNNGVFTQQSVNTIYEGDVIGTLNFYINNNKVTPSSIEYVAQPMNETYNITKGSTIDCLFYGVEVEDPGNIQSVDVSLSNTGELKFLNFEEQPVVTPGSFTITNIVINGKTYTDFEYRHDY